MRRFSNLCVFPNFKYFSKYFAQIYRAQYGATMLVYLNGSPAWGEGWKIVWTSGTYFGYLGHSEIFSTDQANI